MKNVTGRKTDVLDCQWLQQLHTYGLLRASFRPSEQICAIRSFEEPEQPGTPAPEKWRRKRGNSKSRYHANRPTTRHHSREEMASREQFDLHLIFPQDTDGSSMRQLPPHPQQTPLVWWSPHVHLRRRTDRGWKSSRTYPSEQNPTGQLLLCL